LNDLDPEHWLRFEQLVRPHVDAAFNLARWLLRSRADAEDVAQEALLRACRFFRSFRGGDARAWLLHMMRNTCYTWLEKNDPVELSVEFDEELHLQTCPTPETISIAGDDRERLTAPSRRCRPVSAKSSSFESSKVVPIRRSQRSLGPDNFHVFEDNVEQEIQYSSSENAPISHELGSLTLSRGAEGSGPHKRPAPGSLIARK
jgi:RNA polymerase sigma factor (sigma-70 family)